MVEEGGIGDGMGWDRGGKEGDGNLKGQHNIDSKWTCCKTCGLICERGIVERMRR